MIMNFNFRHELAPDGKHRIVEDNSNTIGYWALYESPAFLNVSGKTFSVLTSYYQGVDRNYPPIENVFEVITHKTECVEI